MNVSIWIWIKKTLNNIRFVALHTAEFSTFVPFRWYIAEYKMHSDSRSHSIKLNKSIDSLNIPCELCVR